MSGSVCDYNTREAPRLRRGAERGGLGAISGPPCERTVMKIATRGGAALRRRLAAVDVRPHRDRRRARRLGRVQRQPQPATASPAASATWTHLLIGQDPRPVERLYWDMLRAHAAEPAAASRTRPSPASSWRCGTSRPRRSACRSTSCSAARCAIACGCTGRTAAPRARGMWQMLGTPPLRTYDDIAALGQGGRGARLHRAQDQHRHPGRAGHRLLPRLRARHQHHRRRADASRSSRPSSG